jgi:hypothetical protein
VCLEFPEVMLCSSLSLKSLNEPFSVTGLTKL